MAQGPHTALSLLRAHARARSASSRELIAHAHDRAQDQQRHARAARTHAEQQAEQTINRWPANHGLAARRTGQPRANALQEILHTARALFDGCGAVSLTTLDQLGARNPYRTAIATGRAEALDATQYRLREGPTIDAVELDMVAVLRADDLAEPGEAAVWPRFSRAAVGLGTRSALSISLPWTALRVGLQAEQHALAAVTFYAAEPHTFAQTENHAMMLGYWAGSIATGTAPAEVRRAGLPRWPDGVTPTR
jgi:hypothetical protein